MSTTTRIAIACVVFAVALVSIASAKNINYSDTSQINVLRRYGGANPAVNQVTGSVSGIFRVAAGDGGGWNDEMSAGSPTDTFTHTWNLPGLVPIDSWNVQMNTAPGTMRIDYSSDGGGIWNTWDTQSFTPGSTYANSSFTPGAGTVTANAIRYVATAGATGTFRIDEVRVLMPAGETVNLGAGYNLFTQPGLVTAEATSTTTGAWRAPNGGNSGTLHNGIVRFDSELKNQDYPPIGNSRTFVRYELNDLTFLTGATFGGSNGQGWQGNWELYTAAGSPSDPQGLGNTIGALTAGGWTLQYSYTLASVVGGAPAYDFALANPGAWDKLLVVFDSQQNAMQELELHNNIFVPEPATLGLFGLGGLLTLRRRRRG